MIIAFTSRLKRAKLIPIAEIPAIPEAAVKNRYRMVMRDFGALRAGLVYAEAEIL